MDAHLRRLERDAAQGNLEASRQLLLERVRLGLLGLDRLRLAAFLGDPGSRLVLDTRWGRASDLRQWLQQLVTGDEEPAVRAGTAAVAFLHEHVSQRTHWQPQCDALLFEVEAYLLEPDESRRSRVQGVADGLRRAVYEAGETQYPVYAELALADAVSCFQVDATLSGGFGCDAVNCSALELRNASRIPFREGGAKQFRWLTAEKGDAVVREAIARDLIPWALGECDPLRERHEAR